MRKTELLETIKGIRDSRRRQALFEFKRELSKMQEHKKRAYKRMKRQEKAGDAHGAELSRKAYDYCAKREEQLSHNIDGYEKLLEGGTYFTKDSRGRYKGK